MTATEKERAAERFRLALDLYQAGEDLMRQNLRRRYPDDDGDAVEARLVAWLQHRPGAEHGDTDGRAVPWPRAAMNPG